MKEKEKREEIKHIQQESLFKGADKNPLVRIADSLARIETFLWFTLSFYIVINIDKLIKLFK